MADQVKDKGAQAGAPDSQPQGGKGDPKPKKEKFTVVVKFADKDKFGKKWDVGDDVSHFDEGRLQSAIKRGLVKKGK